MSVTEDEKAQNSLNCIRIWSLQTAYARLQIPGNFTIKDARKLNM